jgi:hypothetical protein
MNARIEGTCKNCGDPILIGDEIAKQTIARADKQITAWMHVGCPARSTIQIRARKLEIEQREAEYEAHEAYLLHQSALAAWEARQQAEREEAAALRDWYAREPEVILPKLQNALRAAVASHPRTLDSFVDAARADHEIGVAKRRLLAILPPPAVESLVREAWAA